MGENVFNLFHDLYSNNSTQYSHIYFQSGIGSRSLMPSLSTAGRDQRLPEGSKVRAVCHKASVQVRNVQDGVG